jgi:hypothetical protein
VSVLDRNSGDWINRKVKGWAVLNQWSFQLSNVDPYLFVVDPETEGEELPVEELPYLIRFVARDHVGGLLGGLKLYRLAASISYSNQDSAKRQTLGVTRHYARSGRLFTSLTEKQAAGLKEQPDDFLAQSACVTCAGFIATLR